MTEISRHELCVLQNRLRPRLSAGMRLTPRKVQVVVATFLTRAVRSDQFDPLFGSVKGRNKCLRQLVGHGYLDRAAVSFRFAASVYHIGRAGVPVALAAIAGQGTDLSDEEIRMLRRRPVLSQLEHTLRIVDVYGAFVLRGEGGSGVSVARFLPEQAVRFEYDVRIRGSAAWRQRCFAPDGAFVISAGEGVPAVVLFVEVDLATVPLTRFAAKYGAFDHVVAGGLASARTGCANAAMAVVTVSEARLRRLRRLAEEAGCSRVVLTTFAEVERGGLSARWTEAGSGRPLTLRELLAEIGG